VIPAVKEPPVKIRMPAVAAVVLITVACGGVYYRTMEKVGIHKRDIVVE